MNIITIDTGMSGHTNPFHYTCYHSDLSFTKPLVLEHISIVYQFIRRLICMPLHHVQIFVTRYLIQILPILELDICSAEPCGRAVEGVGQRPVAC